MSFCVVVLACLAPTALGENPLGKVVQLMDSLAAKIQTQGEVEAKAYKEYVEFCDDASANKGFEIKTATAKKAKLEATIAKSADDASAASSKIEELAGSIKTSEDDLKSATAIREKESADFKASETELVDTIDTLSRAISTISREMAKNPAAFAQIDSSNLQNMIKSLSAVVDAAAFSSADQTKLMALVQSQQESDADDGELGAPSAAVYKSHSGNIVDTLEDLKEKAEEQLSALRKAETSAKHNFSMVAQSLKDQAAADTKDFGEEKSARAAAEETKAVSEKDLAGTDRDLADGKKALETANSNCMQVAADHEATVRAREEELKVIAEAKQILKSTTSGAEAQSYSLLQVSSGLQTRADLANIEVVTLVKRLAKEHHSAALAQLASRIAAVLRYGSSTGEDPFSKVKSLISDLIAKLEKEAGSDADEKAYCDEQMTKTEAKKEDLEGDIAKLTSKIDQAASKSANLKEQVKESQADLSSLARQQAEMDNARRDQNAGYLKAKAELEEGLEGVRKAISVLRDYYGGASAAAMLQSGTSLGAAMEQPAAPEQHSKAVGAGQSIIGILEVCESDFARDLAAEETEESDSASDYDKMTQENSVTKTLKEQDVKYNTQEFQSLDKSLAELSSDRETTGTELSAVLEYYSKVKDRCIAKPETYESRKDRRQAEIKGLKEALSILESETAFTQRGKRGLRGGFLQP